MANVTDINIAEWGIEKLAFALRKEDGTYDKPVMHPGAISLNISNSDNNNNDLSADNGLYYRSSGAASKTGELNVAKFRNWFLVNVLGQIEEGDGIGEGAGEAAEFAMLWQVDGNQGGSRNVWYSCTSSDITQNFSTTTSDGTITYATETVTVTSSLTDLPNGERRRKWKCEKGSENYDTFFDAVYYPTTDGGEG